MNPMGLDYTIRISNHQTLHKPSGRGISNSSEGFENGWFLTASNGNPEADASSPLRRCARLGGGCAGTRRRWLGQPTWLVLGY